MNISAKSNKIYKDSKLIKVTRCWNPKRRPRSTVIHFSLQNPTPPMKILETVPEFIDKYRLTKNLPACISNSGNEHEIYYGVSTRTIVGLSNPAGPLYATLPRYLVAGANVPKVRLMAPVLPNVAETGAVTIDTEGGNTSNNIGITNEVRIA